MGQDFWFAYPSEPDANDNTTVALVVYISSPTAVTGAAMMPGLGINIPFSVAAGGTTPVTLDDCATTNCASGTYNGSDLTIQDNDEVDNYGIEVTVSGPAAVEAGFWQPYASDSTLVYPVQDLGTEYYVMSYEAVSITGLGETQFGLVATQDNTSVTITSTESMGPTTTTRTITAGIPYVIQLNTGQSYDLDEQAGYDGPGAPSNGVVDLTGTHITSNNPIALFCGQYSLVPMQAPGYNIYGAENYLYEQIPPLQDWSTHYLYEPLSNTSANTFRFLSAHTGTQVSVNGTVMATLNAGQFSEMPLVGASDIHSNYPMLMAEFHDGLGYDNSNGDPFMMMVPPVARYLTQYQVYSGTNYSLSPDYLNIVVPTGGTGTVTVDGSVIPSTMFNPIGTSGYSGANDPVTQEEQHVITSALPVGVQVYGESPYDGYGYVGGEALEGVTTGQDPFLTETPALTTLLVGSDYCATANLMDQSDSQPIPCAEVDFTVAGANPLTQTALTDASGNAQLCYTGIHAGLDQVEAQADSQAQSVTVIWTTPTPTPSHTPTPTATPTATKTPTPTKTPTGTFTPTPTPSPTRTSSPTPTPSPSPVPSATSTATPTHTDTPTPSSTRTYTPTRTPTPSATPSPTRTPTSTPTVSPTPSMTSTVTDTPTITFTPTISPTPTITLSPTPICYMHVWPDPYDPNTAYDGQLRVDCLLPGDQVSLYTVSAELVQKLEENGGLATWDGLNRRGMPCSPGVYFFVVQASDGGVRVRGKFILVR